MKKEIYQSTNSEEVNLIATDSQLIDQLNRILEFINRPKIQIQNSNEIYISLYLIEKEIGSLKRIVEKPALPFDMVFDLMFKHCQETLELDELKILLPYTKKPKL